MTKEKKSLEMENARLKARLARVVQMAEAAENKCLQPGVKSGLHEADAQLAKCMVREPEWMEKQQLKASATAPANTPSDATAGVANSKVDSESRSSESDIDGDEAPVRWLT
jgi:hypothetical protein